MSSTFNFNSRHLAPSEIVSDILHSYGSSILLHIAMIKSQVRLTKEDFTKALAVLADFQPALRMHIVTENKGKEGVTKRFVESKHLVPDVTIVTPEGDNAWLQLAEEELVNGFNTEDGPLWKIVFVDRSGDNDTNINNNPPTSVHGDSKLNEYVKLGKVKTVRFREDYKGVILFKIHHAIADGISMFDVIYRQLIPILHRVIKSQEKRAFQVPLSMLPAVDESFLQDDGALRRNTLLRKSSSKKKRQAPKPPSGGEGERDIQTMFTPLLYAQNGHKIVPTCASGALLLPVTIGPSATREIVARCDEHNVPVLSALVTAAAVSFSIMATVEGFSLPGDIKCGLQMDLREYRTMTGYQPLGNWLGSGTVGVKSRKEWIGPEQFWPEVKKVYERISTEKPWKNFEVYNDAIKSFIKSDGDIAFAADLFRPHFELFDIGNCDFSTAVRDQTELRISMDDILDDQLAIRLDEHFFATAMSDVTVSPLSMTSCVYRGRIMFTVNYNPRWIPRTFATSFVDVFLTLLHDVIPITPEKIEYKKQTKQGTSVAKPIRGVQQRLAWKEREHQKKERKEFRRAVLNASDKELKALAERKHKARSLSPNTTTATLPTLDEQDRMKTWHPRRNKREDPELKVQKESKPTRITAAELNLMPPAVRARAMEQPVRKTKRSQTLPRSQTMR